MWADYELFYHIYPLGFCGAERENKISEPVNRIKKISEFIPHLKKLGVGAVYLGPVFESSAHGYDTANYAKIDSRLGTNEDFSEVCRQLKQNNIRIVLDGVFNHVGRNFWAFEDVKEKRQSSPYAGWFNIDFNGNSGYNDGFWYEGWEGHYELVKLNLNNNDVKKHIFDSIRLWHGEFGIDGLRLDVAYCLDKNFVRELCGFCRSLSPEFWLLGEMIHGDYNTLLGSGMLDSVTNYECYKGLYSSFNSKNMFEIAHSVNRQFGNENWCLYRGKHLYTFADNHDVSRVASIISNPEHLKPLYALMFAMPGIPSVYYGSEWGIKGEKRKGDDNELRPCLELLEDNDLSCFIGKLAEINKKTKAFADGSYEKVHLTNEQYIFKRYTGDETVYAAINISGGEYSVNLNIKEKGVELLSGEDTDLSMPLNLKPYGIKLIKKSI